jgi:hypothetical protein
MKEIVNTKTVLALITGMLVIGGAAVIISAIRSASGIEHIVRMNPDDENNSYFV